MKSGPTPAFVLARVCAGVAACFRRQQRGVHAAGVARLPVSRDSSSEPESAAGATIQQPD
jgi:hypothetical protein